MKHEFIHREGNCHVVVFFAGWGMDANVLRHISRPGYDILAVWDYSSMHIDWSCLESYDEICLFAWSMGVYAASLTTQALEPRLTLCVAINGTGRPIDSRYGIPEDTFFGTLDGLNERSLAKFFRRMCASKDHYMHFQQRLPSRDVEELRGELHAIADSQFFHAPSGLRWDLAVIGREDRIFPFHNQLAHWRREGVRIKVIDAGHYFDFNPVVNAHLIDKPLVKTRFGAGTATYTSQAGVQAEVVDHIMALCREEGVTGHIVRSVNRVLEIGSGSGLLSRRIAKYLNKAPLEMWDLAAPMPADLPSNRSCNFVNCDAEMQIRSCLPGSCDAIFSASTIQWFNSPERFMAAVARALVHGGFAVISTFVKGNLSQISDITGHSLPLPTAEEWFDMASRHFHVQRCLTFERDLDFETPIEVLRHLKLTGVNAITGGGDANSLARRIISRYPMMLDGRYHLTYRPIIIILKRK